MDLYHDLESDIDGSSDYDYEYDHDYNADQDSERYSSPDPYSDSRPSSSPAASGAEEDLEDELRRELELAERELDSAFDEAVHVGFGGEFGLEEYELDEAEGDSEDGPGFELVFEGGDEEYDDDGGDLFEGKSLLQRSGTSFRSSSGVNTGRRSEAPSDSRFAARGTGSLPPIGSILDYHTWAPEIGNSGPGPSRLHCPLPPRRDLTSEESGIRSRRSQRQNSRQSPYHLSQPRERTRMADMADRDELIAVEVGQARSTARNSRTPSRAAAPEVIDLTGEPDSPEEPRAAAPARARVSNPPQNASRNPRRQRSLNQRTPSLSRSDGSLLGNLTDVIDLTMDDPPPPPPLPQAIPRHYPSTSRPPNPPSDRHRPHPPPVDLEMLDSNPFFRFVSRLPTIDFVRLGGVWGSRQPASVDVQIIGRTVDMNNPLSENLPNLNYRVGGHGERSRKPPHVPPPAARAGFTRNTGVSADEVAVCPSCEKELQYDPDDDDANGPPAKRARTKKDREEHHFWAVKECGHVSFVACRNSRTVCSETDLFLL